MALQYISFWCAFTQQIHRIQSEDTSSLFFKRTFPAMYKASTSLTRGCKWLKSLAVSHIGSVMNLVSRKWTLSRSLGEFAFLVDDKHNDRWTWESAKNRKRQFSKTTSLTCPRRSLSPKYCTHQSQLEISSLVDSYIIWNLAANIGDNQLKFQDWPSEPIIKVHVRRELRI